MVPQTFICSNFRYFRQKVVLYIIRFIYDVRVCYYHTPLKNYSLANSKLPLSG
jgi:hypothetical protein